MELEIQSLDLCYRNLRIVDAGRLARLTASIAQEEQREPVIVVPAEPKVRLIDGNQRVMALESLGRDTVKALVMQLTEVDALLLTWKMERSRPRSALEDGWLIQELMVSHGLNLRDLITQFQRSKSWVSGRLALVQILPPLMQSAVREGRLPPHGVMKYFVPLARANRKHCERLAASLSDNTLTVREIERLYLGWKTGDLEQRERIIDNPLLFLKAEVAAASPPPIPVSVALELASELEGISGLCRKIRKRIRHGAFARANSKDRLTVMRSWSETQLAYEGLMECISAEFSDA